MQRIQFPGFNLPRTLTPEQKVIAQLFLESGGYCVVTKKPCSGHFESTSITDCRWSGEVCLSPLAPGATCEIYHKRDPDIPAWPCEVVTIANNRWQCDYGKYPCYSAMIFMTDALPPRRIVIGELVFGIPPDFKEVAGTALEGLSPVELKAMQFTFGKGVSKFPLDYQTTLIREWAQLHRSLKEEQWARERKLLHDLGERVTGQLRGHFSDISRVIVGEEKPGFYLKEKGIMLDPKETGRFVPVIKVEIPASSVYDPQKERWVPETFLVDISSAMKKGVTISKNA